MKGEYSAMRDAAVATITCRGFLSFTIFTGRFCRCTGGTGNIFTIGAILHLCMARRRAAFGAADGSGPGTAIPGTFWL